MRNQNIWTLRILFSPALLVCTRLSLYWYLVRHLTALFRCWILTDFHSFSGLRQHFAIHLSQRCRALKRQPSQNLLVFWRQPFPQHSSTEGEQNLKDRQKNTCIQDFKAVQCNDVFFTNSSSPPGWVSGLPSAALFGFYLLQKLFFLKKKSSCITAIWQSQTILVLFHRTYCT